ncbi:MAG TPA: pseudouridine synthase [Hyphomicrobiaceae bacterium]|nr:pseudouridine synthase [Hyphomicrobiaceae bacterium]
MRPPRSARPPRGPRDGGARGAYGRPPGARPRGDQKSERTGEAASRKPARTAKRTSEPERALHVPAPQRRPRNLPPASGRPTEEMRIAKALARAGLCSRREAEKWIAEGRVKVNGKKIASPALDVSPSDRIEVDGKPLPDAEPVRLWRYHKPRGLVTTHRDPEGRPTVFDKLPPEMPRVMSIGRLDLNTEGLLLLTNDGALARHLELPATGWLRRYRVRAHGKVEQAALDKLKNGVEIEGVRYGPVEASVDREQGHNIWITMALREGKNREVRKILNHLGLDVNRLIRVSYGPFQLLDLEPGAVETVRRKVIADQLGPRIARELGLTDRENDAEARRSRSKKPKDET